MIIDYVERYKDVFGVEPICTTLTSADVPIAPSTFYAARTRPPSARAVRDEDLKPVIARVHRENYGVYGIRKMHAQLNREEVLAGFQPIARCTTQRLMKDLGLRGISRAKGPRTTVPGTTPDTRQDQPDPWDEEEGGSSPDNDGTGQHCQMVWVRLAGREGVREEPAAESPSRDPPARTWRIRAGEQRAPARRGRAGNSLAG